jgi:hypothetical protein
VLRALRDERVAALRAVDPDIAAVAQRELGALVDKLAAGEPYRLTRDELPRRRCSPKTTLACHSAPHALCSGRKPTGVSP